MALTRNLVSLHSLNVKANVKTAAPTDLITLGEGGWERRSRRLGKNSCGEDFLTSRYLRDVFLPDKTKLYP